jgi:hypothetical protein
MGLEIRSETIAPFIQPHILTTRTDIAKGMIGEPLITLKDKQAVRLSLQKFEKYMNTGGALSDFSTPFQKQDNAVNGLLVKAQVNLNPKWRYIEEDFDDPGIGYFKMDGDYGFTLGIKQDGHSQPVWCSIVSFNQHPIGEKCPLIIQLQGRSYYDKVVSKRRSVKKDVVFSTLSALQWERMMTELVIAWSDFAHLPYVYMQPADHNSYVIQGYLPFDKAKIRYDVTARRLGFKRENRHYALALQNPFQR